LYEEQCLTFNKIKMVRSRDLTADEIGMVDSEIESFKEPVRPGSAQHFVEFEKFQH
jgi:hypothetical protein